MTIDMRQDLLDKLVSEHVLDHQKDIQKEEDVQWVMDDIEYLKECYKTNEATSKNLYPNVKKWNGIALITD